MNRKIVISVLIIILLAAVIAVKRMNFTSGVPTLSQWSGSADEISVKAEGYSLKLANKDGKWLINEKGYAANTEAVSEIEKKIRELKLLDLISEKGYFDKYDLSPEKGIEVVVTKSGKQLRKLIVGKSGASGSQVYVRIDDSKEVYLASGITPAELKPEADTLREKKIFDIRSDDVASFSIRYSGREYRFSKKAAEKKEEKKPSEGKTPAPEPVKWICDGSPSLELDSGKISGIVNSFAPLRAATFAEKPDRGSELCTVKVKTQSKEYLLTIYSKKDKEMYYATSPESPYIFTLGGWQTEKFFIKNIKDLEKKK